MALDTQSVPTETTPHLATRRNVLRSAWSVPVIVALGMNPIRAYAQGNGGSSSSFSGSHGGSVAQISDCNNGHGNGDQCAPGNSGGNNNAENGPGRNGGGNGGGHPRNPN